MTAKNPPALDAAIDSIGAPAYDAMQAHGVDTAFHALVALVFVVGEIRRYRRLGEGESEDKVASAVSSACERFIVCNRPKDEEEKG